MKPEERQGQGELFSAGAAPPSPRAAPSAPPVLIAEPALPVAEVAVTREARARPPVVGAPSRIERPMPAVLTVSELTQRIKGALESRFQRVLVRGEVSGFRGPNARGHLYFNLKDADACIEVCVWASQVQRMRFRLRDGLTVVAEGSVDVYAPRGRYSLIVQRLEPEGEGALALAFQQLKERLTLEGLMGENRRRPARPLPVLPRRIGVVTSRTGAALQDFLRVLHGRHPRLSVLVADARVQGEGAAEEVCRALERLYRSDVDVIVVTRGGGSLEDLWTFNEESVARAIHASPVPIVSAVGHEVDFTIADFVADHRAPTPSAAGERLAPVLLDLELGLKGLEVRLRRSLERLVLERRARLHRQEARLPDLRRWIGGERQRLSDETERLGVRLRARVRSERETLRTRRDRLERFHPHTNLGVQRQHVQRLAERLVLALRRQLEARRHGLGAERVRLTRHSPRAPLARAREVLSILGARLPAMAARSVAGQRGALGALGARLDAMSPLAVLARGYSLTLKAADGRLVRRAEDVQVGERLFIRLGANAHTLDECQTLEAVLTGKQLSRAGQE